MALKQKASHRARSERVISRDVLPETMKSSERINGERTCGACLLAIEDGEVGLVDNCLHVFHHDCADRWSSTENSCPQCKQRFFWLAAYSLAGKRSSLRRVERRDQEAEEDDDFEDVQACEKCHAVGDEATLLLCDGMHGTCNAAFHMACVGLSQVPRGSWFCPDCVERGFDMDSRGQRRERERERRLTRETLEIQDDDGTTRTAMSSSSLSTPLQEPVATPPQTAVEPVFGRRRSAQQSALPSQLRLSALACVTPAVEIPNLKPRGGSEAGLFESFAKRRRAQTQDEASFIKLNPSYEEDFMGGKTS